MSAFSDFLKEFAAEQGINSAFTALFALLKRPESQRGAFKKQLVKLRDVLLAAYPVDEETK
jgi:hypothetical protein